MIAPLEQELLAAFRSLRRKAQRLLENASRIDAERGPPTHRVNSNCLKELRHAVEEARVVERWAKAQQKGTGEEKERDEWRARAERAEAALRVVARQTSPDMAMLECAKLAAEVLAASGATPTCATCFGTGYIAEDHRDNAEAVPCPDCVGKERR